MFLTKQEQRRIMQVWGQYETELRMVFDRLTKEYSDGQIRQDSEWETLRQAVEFTAKKQALIDFKNVFSKHYVDNSVGE